MGESQKKLLLRGGCLGAGYDDFYVTFDSDGLMSLYTQRLQFYL